MESTEIANCVLKAIPFNGVMVIIGERGGKLTFSVTVDMDGI
jgi:hypothetical protein